MATCWVCLEAGSTELLRGCACRGSAGYAHLDCLVQVAASSASSTDAWQQCPTCQQDYTGSVSVGLSRARWALASSRPLTDPGRLAAASQLASALCDWDKDFHAAQPLMEETLAARRRTLGNDHPLTLASMNNLGHLYRETGNFDAAQPLYEEALATRRRKLGDEHASTLMCINNVGILHSSKGDHTAARPLMEEALSVMRRTLGDGHPQTLTGET